MRHLHNAWQIVGTEAINPSSHIASEVTGENALQLPCY